MLPARAKRYATATSRKKVVVERGSSASEVFGHPECSTFDRSVEAD
jgi:hypothetical protein